MVRLRARITRNGKLVDKLSTSKRLRIKSLIRSCFKKGDKILFRVEYSPGWWNYGIYRSVNDFNDAYTQFLDKDLVNEFS